MLHLNPLKQSSSNSSLKAKYKIFSNKIILSAKKQFPSDFFSNLEELKKQSSEKLLRNSKLANNVKQENEEV